jgi:hypothetical protein
VRKAAKVEKKLRRRKRQAFRNKNENIEYQELSLRLSAFKVNMLPGVIQRKSV